MVEGIHTFLDRETARLVSRRERFWKRDYASAETFSRSLSANRERFRKIIGEVGRHIIGYETQKVLSVVDWFAHENARHKTPIAVAGYGEGGLLALYSAALDERIAATLVSGYFQPRENLWQEPIYRDVWGLLREFGDAGIAGMIAP